MQSILIYTHLTVTPDMLHDISTQIESGQEHGFTPYEWELWDDYIEELKDEIKDLKDDIDDLNNDIDDYKDEIRELEKLYEETDDEVKRLKDLLSDNNISYE